ncbi:hypothetical protein KC19_VG106900 [Ceratodon purpureus]|uniref:Uncharacterized protein n=1 Tax=Ceratodon purpureus TaxID=3225 RepID=A0A8T0HP91_CERPU|nr:hypothetical protein KC19_VG106900 [Ceratodon purpureus]
MKSLKLMSQLVDHLSRSLRTLSQLAFGFAWFLEGFQIDFFFHLDSRSYPSLLSSFTWTPSACSVSVDPLLAWILSTLRSLFKHLLLGCLNQNFLSMFSGLDIQVVLDCLHPLFLLLGILLSVCSKAPVFQSSP